MAVSLPAILRAGGRFLAPVVMGKESRGSDNNCCGRSYSRPEITFQSCHELSIEFHFPLTIAASFLLLAV